MYCNGPSLDIHIYLFSTSFATLNKPLLSLIWNEYASDLSNIVSFKNCKAPCDNIASRSISPILKPPPAALPEGGCFVFNETLPFSLELILSLTICFNLW